MGTDTAIEWATHTFNPWIGCTKVSPACTHCYAETYALRYGRVEWGKGKDRSRTKTWSDPPRWNRIAKEAKERHRVFCASLADVFDSEVSQLWREELWELIRKCRALNWLLLTKRPENFKAMVPWKDHRAWPHVWLGTTVENQEYADKRIPLLLEQEAAVRFLSVEPLLGPLDLTPYLGGARSVDWVICGGESGAGARPMDLEWVRSLRDQCVDAGVCFFFKQWGAWTPGLPEPQRVGKKKAGRELDGRTWDEIPEGERA